MVDKSFMFYVLVIIASIYFFPIQDRVHKTYNDSFITINAIGKEVLLVDREPFEVQLDAWQKCTLKEDFLDLYPHFEDMKYFISQRIIADELQTYLYEKLDKIEHQFFSGQISAREAKKRLSR